MSTSSTLSVTIPSRVLRASDRVARRRRVSRSEIVRVALRRYLEEEGVLEAIKVYQKERKFGSLKKLTSLADLAA